MSFQGGELINYKATDLQYPQKLANCSLHTRRLLQTAHDLIKANQNYNKTSYDRNQDYDA
jgi:hypothetical protein